MRNINLFLVSFFSASFACAQVVSVFGNETEIISTKSFGEIQTNSSVSKTLLENDIFIPEILEIDTNIHPRSIEGPLSDHIAAVAVDAKRGNMLYMPMLSSNLYFFDFKHNKVKMVESSLLDPKTCNCQAHAHITRLSWSVAEDVGYAISNDGTMVLKIIPAGETYKIVNLGTLKEKDPAGEESFLQTQKGWGGDMVAANNGKLYIISAKNLIYEVDPGEMEVKYYGEIKDLPEGFTTNGAAVLKNGNILLAGNHKLGMRELDINTLSVVESKYTTTARVYDLGSPFDLPIDAEEAKEDVLMEEKASFSQIQVYPTMLKNENLNLNLKDDTYVGRVRFLIYDAFNHKVFDKILKYNGGGQQTYNFDINSLRSGIYFIKIIDKNENVLWSGKIINQ